MGETDFIGKRQGQKQKSASGSCARHKPTPETATAAIGKQTQEICIRACYLVCVF